MAVMMLFELCQKQGKQVDIKYWKNGEKNVATVYVDGKFIASSSSVKKETAKLNAAKQALLKLLESMPSNVGRLDFSFGLNKSFEIDGAKQKLHELCGKKKWPKPIYGLEKHEGPPHDKKYVYRGRWKVKSKGSTKFCSFLDYKNLIIYDAAPFLEEYQ